MFSSITSNPSELVSYDGIVILMVGFALLALIVGYYIKEAYLNFMHEQELKRQDKEREKKEEQNGNYY